MDDRADGTARTFGRPLAGSIGAAMSACAAIRTHRWSAAEERLLARLGPVFGPDLAVVFHNRPADVVPPLPTVDITDAWVREHRLLLTQDWGWRCGDYAFYALRKRFPAHDHYWLIEPDVHFTSDAAPFFAACASAAEDALGSRVGRPRDRGRFAVGMGEVPLWRATFALTRLSGRAIDHLLPARRQMVVPDINHRFWPNDEFFVYSVLQAAAGMTVGSFETYAPGWFEGTAILPSPDNLLEAVEAGVPPGRVIHPVHDRAAFMRAIVQRLVAASGFLARCRGSLACLSDPELDAIAATLAAEIGRELRQHKQSHRRAARRARAPAAKARASVDRAGP